MGVMMAKDEEAKDVSPTVMNAAARGQLEQLQREDDPMYQQDTRTQFERLQDYLNKNKR